MIFFIIYINNFNLLLIISSLYSSEITCEKKLSLIFFSFRNDFLKILQKLSNNCKIALIAFKISKNNNILNKKQFIEIQTK